MSVGGSFGSLKGRPKGNACLIVFACVRHAYKGDTWSLWTCIWLPFAICLLMQIYFPNISLVRVDPRSTRYRQRPDTSQTKTTPEGELANPTKMCPAIIPTADPKSTQACDGEASRGSQVRRICPSRPFCVD